MSSAPFNATLLAEVQRSTIKSRETGTEYLQLLSLPIGYEESDRTYPLLLLLDGNLMFATAAESAATSAITGDGQPVIVVGIGTAESLAAHSIERLRDYLPFNFNPPVSPAMFEVRKSISDNGLDPDLHMGGADTFLAFLQQQVLPALVESYRVDTSNISLLGHSGGGAFAAYALLSQAAPFSSFVIGSFGAAWLGPKAAILEAAFIEDARKFKVFHGMGGEEAASVLLGSDLMAGQALMTRLAEGNPNLDLTTKIFPDETHSSVVPHLLASGLRLMWPGAGYRLDR